MHNTPQKVMPASGRAASMPPLTGKRALILVEDHVEDLELLFPKFVLEDAGVEVHVAGRALRTYTGKKGYEIPSDTTIADAAQENWDLVHVPGGYAPDKLRTYPEVLQIVQKQMRSGKPLGAICHAPWVLASAGVADGKRLTSWHSVKDDLRNAGADWVDEKCVVDGNLVTSRFPGDLPAYCRALLGLLQGEDAQGERGEPRAAEASAQETEQVKAATKPGPQVTAAARGR
jgi:protease I